MRIAYHLSLSLDHFERAAAVPHSILECLSLGQLVSGSGTAAAGVLTNAMEQANNLAGGALQGMEQPPE